MNSYKISDEITIDDVKINDTFWNERNKINSESAIFHQWEKLEETGTIDNFRIVSGEIDQFRQGYFYVDSDAHKWAEAAATILQTQENPQLLNILQKYLDLLISAQEEDGYIFTYNQLHFPKKRWINIQIEHELYTLGHLIEASIAAYKITNSIEYLNLGKKAADLLVRVFDSFSPKYTPGHPEIEIALVKLYRFTNEKKYLKLAKDFIYKRGKFLFFGYEIFKENLSHSKRANEVSKQKTTYYGEIKREDSSLMSEWPAHSTKLELIRFYFYAITGKYLQQNKQIKNQRKPIGHCVRWGYLATAATMIFQETGDISLLKSLQIAWDNMVKKRMYVTGGIGSLPLPEGFGRDYELDNKSAYNETCAAISSIFWNWELLLSTGSAKYADLIEWQLYNAVLVGMSADGKSYFYRNPLEANKDFERKDWYKTACCPSNISRTFANLAKYLYSYDNHNIWIHQYIGNSASINLDKQSDTNIKLELTSDLPWGENVKIDMRCDENLDFFLNLRIPGWTSEPRIIVNGKNVTNLEFKNNSVETASDLAFYESYYLSLKEDWMKENTIEISFPMKIKSHKSHRKVKNNKDKVAFSRGPITYCLEDIDNPKVDITNIEIDRNSEVKILEKEDKVFLKLNSKKGHELIARPYYSWGNKGKSSMRLWI